MFFAPTSPWRTALFLVVLTTLALAAAGCGGGSPNPSGTTASTPQASASGSPAATQVRQAALLKYATCMRAHGVPSFPDPRNGTLILPAGGTNPSAPQFQSANQACQSLLPNGGRSQVTSPANRIGLARFAVCMTKRGFPMSESNPGSVSFPNNVDPNSPSFQAAFHICDRLVPEGLP